MFNLSPKRSTLKIPLSVFPFRDICVYYITVYKQKNSTWNEASWESRGCPISSKGELPFQKNSHLAASHALVTSDVTERSHITRYKFEFTVFSKIKWETSRDSCQTRIRRAPLCTAPQHNGPPSSCTGKCYGVPNKTIISCLYFHEPCLYLTILCALPCHPDARVLPNHSIST